MRLFIPVAFTFMLMGCCACPTSPLQIDPSTGGVMLPAVKGIPAPVLDPACEHPAPRKPMPPAPSQQ